jgi:HJR/Mrr/RecB family endonuclease
MTKTITRLQRIDPYDFEEFIADLWQEQGWRTKVTQASNDGGIDVIASKGLIRRETWAFQVKRHGPNTKVGTPDIQQYSSLPHQHRKIDRVAIISSNEFTKGAREIASKLDVTLIGGEKLVKRCHRNGAVDLIDKYDPESVEPSWRARAWKLALRIWQR